MGQLAIAGRNASIDAVNAQLNGGTLEIRTGTAAAIDSTPTGTAGHYVAKTSGGAAARNGVVGLELTINNASITSGDAVSVTSWTYAQATS